MADDSRTTGVQSDEPQPPTSCLVRLGWLAGGHGLLACIAILIARGERWTLTAKDVAFWLILALILALRYIDWKTFSGTTANGEQATLRDIQRYAVSVVGAWSMSWVVAQSLALG